MTNLENAVLEKIKSNIEGMTKGEASYWVKHDAICEAGSVSGLIYCKDTCAFFDDHEEEILSLTEEVGFELSPVEIGMTGYKNNMAWFAFESLKDEVFKKNEEDLFTETNED